MPGGETTYYIYATHPHTATEQQQWLLLKAEIRIKLKEKQKLDKAEGIFWREGGEVSQGLSQHQGKPQANEPSSLF